MAIEVTELIRLAHTVKIDAIFQIESGVPPGFQTPVDDRFAEFDANLTRKWGFLFGVFTNRISTEVTMGFSSLKLPTRTPRTASVLQPVINNDNEHIKALVMTFFNIAVQSSFLEEFVNARFASLARASRQARIFLFQQRDISRPSWRKG